MHLLDGAGARFSGRPLPAFTGRSEAASSVALVLHPRHAAPMRLRSRTVDWELGPCEQRQRVGPDSLLFPCLDSLSGAAEPPPRSFIKSGRGAQKPALSHLLLSSASAPLSLIRHGEREPRPFIGGGEGRRQTAHLSLFRARGGRASHKGKREGARSRTRSRTRSRRSGKRRTGRRVSFTSAGGSSPHGGPYRGRPLRVLRQAAPGASSSPPASSSVCERDGVGPARDTETAHEGLWDQRHASPRCIPSP